MEVALIRDVQVHLDGSQDDELRLQHAESIAAAVQAHLTGLFTNPLADLAMVMPVDGGAAAVQAMAELDEEARRTGDRIQQGLLERFSRLAVPNEIRRLEASPGELAHRIITEVHYGDLFVASRPYDQSGARWVDLFESALFQGGRSIYVVPPDRGPPAVIRRIVVAWRETREAARAVAEAAPLIAKAGHTKAVLVDAGTGTTANVGEPGSDIARHLGRIGTEVEVVCSESGGRRVSEILLDQAHRMSADLIVMGAYGHSRAREWVLGGATRDMLESSDVALLIAH
jgi:nucleotide-binding universal stress UspA family protein